MKRVRLEEVAAMYMLFLVIHQMVSKNIDVYQPRPICTLRGISQNLSSIRFADLEELRNKHTD